MMMARTPGRERAGHPPGETTRGLRRAGPARGVGCLRLNARLLHGTRLTRKPTPRAGPARRRPPGRLPWAGGLRALCLAFVAPALFAQTADLRITSLTTDKSVVAAGARYTVQMRWKNDGPDAATGVVATIGEPAGTFVISGLGTSGWPCEPGEGGITFICRGNIDPGAEAGMVVTLLAPPNTTEIPAFAARGSLASQTADPHPENNTASVPLQLTDAPQRAELTIGPAAQTHRAAAGNGVAVPLAVTNSGPAEARDLLLTLGFGPGVLVPLSAAGEGWFCSNQTHSPWLVLCSRARLAAGATAPLLAHLIAPDIPLRLTAHVRAERFGENSIADNLAVAGINPAAAPVAEWERLLIPLTGTDVPGANGAVWRTETTAILLAPTEIHPTYCTRGPVPCEVPYPLNLPFDAQRIGPYVRGDWPNGQFVYLRTGEAAKLRLDSRVYDLSRTEQTAGSEIPIVREHEFSAEPLAITGIPLATHYRHTLRVYDLEGRDGARVAIHLYAGGEITPRASTTGTLVLPANAIPLDNHLPSHPAYLQLDPLTLDSLAGATNMRIDIEPLDAGLRIWAFVSVTNNQTHHVTTFSAQ